MTRSNKDHPRPDYVAEKQSPNYRSKHTPRAEGTRECQPANPPGPPSSAAENHEDANRKCDVAKPKSASNDEHEKAVG